MFVSSYSTNVQINNNERVAKEKYEKNTAKSGSFNSKFTSTTQNSETTNGASRVNYISTSLVLNNKRLLEDQKSNTETSKHGDLKNYTQRNSLISAKNAYEENSEIFSLFQIPSVTLDKTPKIEQTLPQEPKEMKELHLRAKMVNTYIANDNYYKITA